MKVILTQKVPTLGNVGETVNVSAGYARNYLIPNRFGVVADSANKKQLANHQKALAKKVEEEKSAATVVKGKVDGFTLEFVKKVGSNGKLFGAITNIDLSKELKAQKDVEIERRLILLDRPIKAIGSYTAKAKLFSGVEAEFNIKVSMDPKQAEEMKAKEAEALKKKEAAEKAAAERAASGEEPEVEVTSEEMTEEQRLQKEVNDLLK